MDQVSHLSPLIPPNAQVEKIKEINKNPDSLKGKKKELETRKIQTKSPGQKNPQGKVQISRGDSGKKVDIFA